MNIKQRIQYGMTLMILTRVGILFFLAVPISVLFGLFDPKEGDSIEGTLGKMFVGIVVTFLLGILLYVGLFILIWKCL